MARRIVALTSLQYRVPMTPLREKRALITGITGQDGSYLAELLLGKGYEVHGIIRRARPSTPTASIISIADPHESPALYLHHGDLTDGEFPSADPQKHQPHEIYNLGAQSHVRVSFDQPEYTADAVGMGTLRLLEAVRDNARSRPQVQVLPGGVFGDVRRPHEPPQNETDTLSSRGARTPSARSPPTGSRVNYREAYGLFVPTGSCSITNRPRRGETFVTRKITRAVGRDQGGAAGKLYLGNLDARRDWGFAGDYVEAMWLMLQQDEPDDFVVATGQSHSVREFLEEAFDYAALDWRRHVEIDPRYFRPSEVDHLRGDASKARAKLGWAPTVGFSELVRMMVDHDWEAARRERVLSDSGRGETSRGAAAP